MKLLKICGIVAGIHAFALLFIFANPGCSSTTPPPPPAADAAASAASAATSPISAAPVTASPAGTAAAGAFDPAAALNSGGRYSPTRPGSAAATVVQKQPVPNVTPVSTYKVQAGDTLSTIAKKNHLTPAALAAANNLRLTSPLRLGQSLIVPTKVSAATRMEVAGGMAAPAAETATSHGSAEPVKHTVKAGETLGQIARKYGVRQGDIAVANAISDPAKLRVGTELTIPGWQATGKPPRSRSSGAAGAATPPAAARDAAAPPAPSPTPGPDLDPGARPAPAAEVPVIKVEDTPAPAK